LAAGHPTHDRIGLRPPLAAQLRIHRRRTELPHAVRRRLLDRHVDLPDVRTCVRNAISPSVSHRLDTRSPDGWMTWAQRVRAGWLVAYGDLGRGLRQRRVLPSTGLAAARAHDGAGMSIAQALSPAPEHDRSLADGVASGDGVGRWRLTVADLRDDWSGPAPFWRFLLRAGAARYSIAGLP
jgi:hypothetical protein